jgi:hypothetical protein
MHVASYQLLARVLKALLIELQASSKDLLLITCCGFQGSDCRGCPDVRAWRSVTTNRDFDFNKR